MNIVDAIGIQINDLIGSIGNTGLPHGKGVRAKLVHQGFEPLRHKGAGELDGPVNLICIGDGHDTGYHRNCDTGFPNLVEEIVKQIVVKEHLGGQEGKSGIHLFFQMEKPIRKYFLEESHFFCHRNELIIILGTAEHIDNFINRLIRLHAVKCLTDNIDGFHFFLTK